MMDIDKIKQKILDLAIRGKLVPQDPNDEPASVLVEKIKAEKEKMVKEGKVKPSKDDSYIYKDSDNCYYEKKGNEVRDITSEIPFEIPNSWCWVRLNDLGIFKKGPFGSSLTKSMFVPESTKNKVKVYEQKNAIQKNANIGHYFISYEKFESMKGFIVGPGELIVSCAGTIGEIFQLPENAEVGIINQALMKIHLYHQSLCTYFILYFDFVLKSQTAEEGKGTCMKNIPPFSILKEKLFPLPPENEIRKILESIKKIFIQIDAIIKNDCSIRTISNALRNKILNQFFGENSSYKSYYPNSSWRIEKMSSICCLYTGNSINKETKLKKYIGHSSGTPYIGTKDIKFNGSIIYDNGVRISSSDLSSFSIAPKDSILLCIEGGSAGRKIAIANQEVCFGNKLCCFVPREINNRYLFYYLQSASFKESFLDKKSGLTGGVSINKLREIKMSYPSLSLQQKIVSVIDNSFCVIDSIFART